MLSSRRDPPIRLHRLRLADEVAEIRAGDLRFTERETRELLATSGISLSDAGAAALHQRTEGWAAGLRLAVISLSGHPDPERFVAEFSGTDRAIGEYLMAEMLERQPSDVQSMLLRTSLVDRLNGELADLLAGRSGSEQMLLELEDANAFVVSLDAQRTWFRYHQLLADFLRLELRRTLADEVPDLHRRAARWFADHGDVVEAVRHTLAAGDWPDAARLVADHSFRWVLDGQAGTIDAVLQAFPEGASADHPDLALAHAASELNHGRLEEAAAQLALAESHVQSAPPARRRRLAVAIASLRLALARRSGQFTEVIEQVNLLDASISDESSEPIGMGSELRAVALLNLGIVETWSGRLDDAERHLSEGAALAQTIGRPYLEVACRAHQGFPSTLVSVATARERGRQAVALAERHGLDDRPILAPALGRGWRHGDLDGRVRRGRALAAPRLGGRRATRRPGRRGASARGDGHVARRSRAAPIGARGIRGGGAGAVATHRRARSRAADRRMARDHAGSPRDAGRGARNAHRILRRTRANRCPGVHRQRACSDLHCGGGPRRRVGCAPRRSGRSRHAVGPAFTLAEAHLLAGIAHLALGDRNAAAAAAEEALAAAEPDRLIFPFALTDAAELLDALPRHETAHGALLADIVDVLRGASAPSTDREPLTQPEELSPSELRVLRYLPTNMTRPEIARELYVSINTVNTHVRNIYAKLDARRSLRRRSTRTGAAAPLDRGLANTAAIAQRGVRNHRIPASPAHQVGLQHDRVATPLGLYTIRIQGSARSYRPVGVPLDGVRAEGRRDRAHRLA